MLRSASSLAYNSQCTKNLLDHLIFLNSSFEFGPTLKLCVKLLGSQRVTLFSLPKPHSPSHCVGSLARRGTFRRQASTPVQRSTGSRGFKCPENLFCLTTFIIQMNTVASGSLSSHPQFIIIMKHLESKLDPGVDSSKLIHLFS